MDARNLATEILLQVIAHGRSLTPLLALERKRYYGDKDYALVQKMCFGVLRHYYWLGFIINQFVTKRLKNKDEDIRILLLLGLYQLHHLKIPQYACVAATVEVARTRNKPWAVGLINGVLRNILRADVLTNRLPSLSESAEWNHPDWLLRMIRGAWPLQWQELLRANNGRAPMSLRVNALKISRERYLEELTAVGLAASIVETSPVAITLDEPVDVGQLPGFEQGWVSLQDVGAQLTPELLRLGPGLRVLDACAAPGGKTCHLLESCADLAECWAVDVDPLRLQRVNDNLVRLGLKAVLITADVGDTNSWWNRQPFQRILLDAPCSATGVIRRHPDIKLLRRAEDIVALASIQKRLLHALWPLLAPGGLLLYSTCSVLPQENEQQMSAFLDDFKDAKSVELDGKWGVNRGSGRQILPGDANRDGFFYALLEKTI